MPPLSMDWTGLNARQICGVMTDPQRNGGRKTPQEIVDHMQTDPLVLWAWEPGTGRKPPPISQQEFASALRRWAAAGAPCPK